MAQQINNVLQGQVTPQARPVDAFIRPGETNVAQPNQLPRLGQPSQINTISTGGTNNVAGVNKFAQLAQDLAEFNPQLTKSLQTMGVMYADSQMQAGERYAKEQALRALANNDNQMEAAELDRAAQNRRLGAKDPNAGTIMASLNPYFGMGVERGNAKVAAEKVALEMPAFFAKNRFTADGSDLLDPSLPDQGFGGLVRLQAEYTQKLTADWGLSAGSPGFQKYTLPEIEKARDRLSQQHVRDRKDYFDTVGVQQTAEQIRAMYRSTEASGSVEVNGQAFSRASDPDRFKEMQQYKAASILENLLLRQSLPGEATARSEDVYKLLLREADYQLDNKFQGFIDSLPSQQVLKDETGKAVVNPKTGQPFRLRWGELYRGVAIDSEMKYEEAGMKKRKEKLLESVDGFEEGLLNAVSGIPPGPAQKQQADLFVAEWYQKNGRAAGISRVELEKRRAEIVKLDDNIYVEGQDPNVEANFFAQLQQTYGQDFNATAQRRRMTEAAQQILDPQRRTSFVERASGDIASREKEMASFSGYNSARNEIVNQAINTNLASYYNVSQAGNSPAIKANVEESKVRQRSAFTQRANDLMQKEEARLKRRLTDTEVRSITRAAIYGDPDRNIAPYGSGSGGRGESGQNQKEYLFPGSRRTDEPNAPGPSGQRAPGKTYEILELGKIENRAALRQYKGVAILTPEATLQAWRFVSGNRPLPPALDRAWRDAKASSPAEFVLGQMDVHRRLLSQKGAKAEDLQRFNPSVEQRSQVLQRSTKAAAGGRTAQSVSSNAQSTPMLAQLGGWALNALTGAAPAAAATMPQQMPASVQRTGRPPVGESRPPQPRAYPLPDSYPGLGEAPAAPVLPAPGGVGSRAGGAAMEPARGGGGSGPVAMASPVPQVSGGGASPVGQVRPALLPGWGVDEAGNLISPTRGMPPLDPIGPQSRIVAVRTDYGGAFGGAGFEKPVSVVYERPDGQPGVDLYFPSKRFPAVLGGVVKDVSRQGGAGSGYGNYVVVESIDPLTGKRVDVLYGHLADGVKVRPGQRIEAGQIIGQQGGTGRVVSQDGTIASIDFFAPRPAGSKDMTPYSGFDRLRRHVVSTLQQGGGGGAIGGQKPDGYLKRLAYLETRIRDIPNAEGSPGRGYFQAFPAFSQEAIAASGGIDPRDGDYGRSAKSTWAWIQKHRPEAAAAIKRGDYETADRILRPTWPSLPGGSQAQPDYVQREARRYLN